MKLSRSQFLTLTAASTLRLAPNRAWAGYGGGEPPYQTKYGVSSRFVQSDDKSWELTLPSSSWSLTAGSLRADPAHLFAAHASRPDASLDVTVDQIPQKKLADLGKLAAVAETYRRENEELLDAIQALTKRIDDIAKDVDLLKKSRVDGLEAELERLRTSPPAPMTTAEALRTPPATTSARTAPGLNAALSARAALGAVRGQQPATSPAVWKSTSASGAPIILH